MKNELLKEYAENNNLSGIQEIHLRWVDTWATHDFHGCDAEVKRYTNRMILKNITKIARIKYPKGDII